MPGPATACSLLVIAAPKEAEAVLRGLGLPHDAECTRINWAAQPLNERFDIVITGVGKANAAAATARALDPARHARIVSLGVSGALPGGGLEVGDLVEAEFTVYADEGSWNPDRFLSIAEMGFGPLADLCAPGNGMDAMSLPCAPALATPVPGIIRGTIATVSTCSGNDSLAAEIARRSGAIAEDMECAAVAFTAARVAPGLPFSALRAISNTTGDRLHQTWDLNLALIRLSDVVRFL